MRYLLTALLFVASQGFAQQSLSVYGTIRSNDGILMNGASVTLHYIGAKDSLKTISGNKGIFKFSQVRPSRVYITISFIGYSTLKNYYDYTTSTGEIAILDIVMIPGDKLLENITLESNKVQIKEDTVSYKVDSTMYRANDNVEEVLKKLPGVTVDKAGNVTAQGKQVTKVKVNGKEFFGGDVTTATREINADMVDRIQVIDDYGDQSAFTGIKDGDPSKTLNIELKKDRNKGYFGNVAAGIGTEDRYMGSVTINKFDNARQISILGNINNTNASTFNFGSMGSMGGIIGGAVRSFGIGRGGAGVGSAIGNFGSSDGIGTTKSIGFNYRDEWSKKVSAYGSYSFSNKGNNSIKDVTQENIFLNDKTTSISNTNDYSVSTNHRFSYNIEYRIDSANYLKFNPAVSYRKSEGSTYEGFTSFANNGSRINDGTEYDLANSSSLNFSGSLLFNHRFAKRGRTLSLNFNAGASSSDANDDYQNNTNYYSTSGPVNSKTYQLVTQDNKNHNYGFRASYIEPLNKKQSLEFNYAYNKQVTGNDKENFYVDPVTSSKTFIDSLSNIYENVYTTNRVGINFRTNEKKYNYAIGLGVQPATIRSNSITAKNSFSQDILNYYPVIRFAYNFSRSRSFNINYNGSSSQPAYSQLQPVYDYSNPQFITLGNPNLKPEFTNTVSMRYNNFDFITGNVFFGNIMASFTNDKIVNNTTDIGLGKQLTEYVNSDGYYTINGFYNISKPIMNRKFVFNLGGNIGYYNNISFVGDTGKVFSQKNTGRNWVAGQRFTVDIKIKKWLETSAGVNYSMNSTIYSLRKEFNSNTQAWSINHSSRLFLPYNFVLSYDIDKTFNNGYASNVNADPLIINSTLEKQFFKKKNLSLKLQA
ncbi:MAG TPA: outer membrane beta-barrel protein, partial [Ferruginibacter sp.]|nr:outer membrane beta-barrel protein [Ferruginibacter sp.]